MSRGEGREGWVSSGEGREGWVSRGWGGRDG